MSQLGFGSAEWRSRITEILTNRSLVYRAKDSELARATLVARYQKAVKAYLKELLLREKDARDSVAAARMADAIHAKVVTRMLSELNKGLKLSGDRRFREALLEWVHQAHWEHTRNPAVEDAAVWNTKLAEDILRKAWKKLEQFQHRRKDSILYTLLRLHEEFPKEKKEAFEERVAALGYRLKRDNVRQQLYRASDRFGRLLVEEVAHLTGDGSPDTLRQELEKLSLVEYARKSKRWRTYLKLDGEPI